jgi:hypothetical protein
MSLRRTLARNLTTHPRVAIDLETLPYLRPLVPDQPLVINKGRACGPTMSILEGLRPVQQWALAEALGITPSAEISGESWKLFDDAIEEQNRYLERLLSGLDLMHGDGVSGTARPEVQKEYGPKPSS